MLNNDYTKIMSKIQVLWKLVEDRTKTGSICVYVSRDILNCQTVSPHPEGFLYDKTNTLIRLEECQEPLTPEGILMHLLHNSQEETK